MKLDSWYYTVQKQSEEEKKEEKEKQKIKQNSDQ